MNVEKYNEYLTIKGYSINTIASNISMLGRFTKWLEKENIEQGAVCYNDVMAFIQSCKQRGNERHTILQYVIAVRHYYNYLISEAEINDNPASNVEIKGIKRRKLHDILSTEELEALYKTYADELPINKHCPPQQLNKLARKRNKIVLGLIIYQAIRPEELATLEISDIKLREGKIVIKGKRRSEERTLKLEGFQVIDLMDYINETRKALLAYSGRQTQQLFFSKNKGQHFSNIMHSLLKSVKKGAIKINNIEQVRTSVITHWLKRYNLRQVQYMAGHRYISSTEAYQATNITALQDEVYKHHPIS